MAKNGHLQAQIKDKEGIFNLAKSETPNSVKSSRGFQTCYTIHYQCFIITTSKSTSQD